ncbi:MAG: hypothetical protein IPL46_21990 [Saprospiraceae bacterium]|nr:hypothetical protein [Saprospiraceae bacterium]
MKSKRFNLANISKSLGLKKTYFASHVFDSRIDAGFDQDKSYKKVWQHFKGWEIETEKPVFDPEVFTMMDFRLKWKDSTSFTYVLPNKPTRALIEFTFFAPFFIPAGDYDKYLQRYIDQFLKVGKYTIKNVEQGIIPMSDYPFHQHHQKNITKIGTGGGWVRPSSGYSFRNSSRYVKQLIENIKSGRSAHQGITRNRFRTYDTIFLICSRIIMKWVNHYLLRCIAKTPFSKFLSFLMKRPPFLKMPGLFPLLKNGHF